MARFDDDYREEVRLADGTEVLLRLVHPEDKQLLLEGFERLSRASRMARFLAPRTGFSTPELRYLTEVDGVRHFAMGAIRRRSDGSEEGIGIARWVRSPDDPEIAEPAITIVDSHQGLGLGTVLLHRLVAAARERGVHRFHCEFFADNVKVRALLEEFANEAQMHRDRDVIVMDFPLPSPRPEERLRDLVRAGPMQSALRHVAGGVLCLNFDAANGDNAEDMP
jgi:RimJ/RimL family protein N-acetyltransferase